MVVQLEVLVVVLVEVVEDVEDMVVVVVVIKWMILYQTIHQKEAEDFMVAPEVIIFIYFKIKKYANIECFLLKVEEAAVAEVVVVVEMIVGHPQTVEEMTV